MCLEYAHQPHQHQPQLQSTHNTKLHSKLLSITHVVTKVHMILRSFVVLTWMRDTTGLV